MIKLQECFVPLPQVEPAPEIKEFFDAINKQMAELTSFDYAPLMEVRIEPTAKTIERLLRQC